MLDTFTFVFDTMADGIRDITKWMKENKPEIDDWVFRIKTLGKVLWELVPALAAVWAMKKVFSLFGLFQGVTAVSLLRRLITGRFNAASLFTLLFGRMGGGSLATRFGFMLGTALKAGLALAKRTLVGAGLLFIVELIETLNGKDTWLSAFAQSDNPFIAWAARIPILLGEAIANLGIGVLLGADWLTALLFGDAQDKKTVEDAISMWATDLAATVDKYGLRPLFDYLKEGINRMSYLSAALRDAATGNLSGMNMNLGMFNASVKTYGLTPTISEFSKTAQSLREKEAAPQNMAILQNRPAGVPWAPNSRFTQQPPTSQTINLTINAEGTPENIKSVATQAFADLMSSSLLGVSANYQGGK